VKNLAASVRERLLQLARKNGEDFNRVLGRYTTERLLYRLSRSSFRSQFVLKGAVLFTVWQDGKPLHRSTKDLDLAGTHAGEPAELAEKFSVIVTQPVEDDGLRFEPLVESQPIRLREGVESGVRLFLTARLGQAKMRLQVDIGFGDEVYPTPDEISFPTLLAFPPPHLQVYHRETVVAEKLQAWLERAGQSSRMKDLFDLRFLAENFAFEGQLLQESVQRTLARRRQSLGELPPYVLSDDLVDDPTQQTQWKAFLSRSKLPPQDLAETVRLLAAFLLPLLQAIQDGTMPRRRWPPGGPWSFDDPHHSESESEDQ